jgi:hypothetical protein
MYSFMLHLHSAVRWVLLLFVLVSVIMALANWKNLSAAGRKIAGISVYLAHFQLLAGIVLYVVSPRVIMSSAAMHDRISRFYLVEHPLAMLIVIIILTIGNSRIKKLPADSGIASATVLFFYGLALILILTLVPWPFMPYGGHWI